jgi:hypothetical protein
MKYLDIAIANEKIKTMDIKGKEYAEVNERIKAFRSICPNGSIATNIESLKDGVVVMSCEVRNEDGKLLSKAYAYEKEDSSFINKTSFIENCCTSATGRALGYLGIGIDTSVASYEEVANAIANQEITKEEAKEYKLSFGRNQGKTIKEVQEEDPKYIEWILNNSNDERLLKVIELELGLKRPSQEEQIERLKLIANINDLCIEKEIDLEEVKEKFKVNELKEMTTEQMKKCVEAMLKKEN